MSPELEMMGEKLKDQRVPIMMSSDEIHAIDAWRRKQDDLPSRSEAIRRMIAIVLRGKKPARS